VEIGSRTHGMRTLENVSDVTVGDVMLPELAPRFELEL
jgi:hypothetical protein